MSPGGGGGAPSPGWPDDEDVEGGAALDDLSIAVARTFGAVVVTVEGRVDHGSAELLEAVLGDLIDGQGNGHVTVELGRADVAPAAVMVFVTAARRARSHGASFSLKAPHADTHEALRSGGYDDLVDVVPGRAQRQ